MPNFEDAERQFAPLRAVLLEALGHSATARDQREEALLLMNATARYQHFQKHHLQFGARVPLHHVASYLGITNVALSRIRRRLQQGDGKSA